MNGTGRSSGEGRCYSFGFGFVCVGGGVLIKSSDLELLSSGCEVCETAKNSGKMQCGNPNLGVVCRWRILNIMKLNETLREEA